MSTRRPIYRPHRAAPVAHGSPRAGRAICRRHGLRWRMSGRSEAVHARGRVCKISPCSAALLVLCGLLAAEVSAQPRPDGAVGARMAPSPERMPSQEPADRRLQWLMIPQVTFRDASLESVLDHFRRKADEASGGAVQVCFKLELPADFRPRYALTLDVRGMPFLAALGYRGTRRCSVSHPRNDLHRPPRGHGIAEWQLSTDLQRSSSRVGALSARPGAHRKTRRAVLAGVRRPLCLANFGRNGRSEKKWLHQAPASEWIARLASSGSGCRRVPFVPATVSP